MSAALARTLPAAVDRDGLPLELGAHAQGTVNDAHRYVLSGQPYRVSAARRAGVVLLEVREALGPEHFRAWVEERCRFDLDTAARYAMVARYWPAILRAVTAAEGDLSRVTVCAALVALSWKQPEGE